MASTVFLDLILNAGLLLGLAVVLDLISARAGTGTTANVGRRWGGQVLAGLAVGLIGIGLMAVPLHAETGVQFDARSVLLSVTGVFLGPLPTVMAMVITGVFRVWLGGAWIVGICVIVTSGTIGLLWRRRYERVTGRQRPWSLYVLGVVVHVVMLSFIAMIPDGVGPRVLEQVFLPVILVFPLATVALGLLLSQRVERETAMVHIEQHDVERERLIAALEQSDDSIVITDATGSIEYVNPAFEAVTGYSREEALGSNPRLLKSGVQDDATYQQLWQTLLAGHTWRGRLVNKRKDGSLFSEDATISPVRAPDGRIASFVAVKRDVTRDLELQAQYLQSQKMEGVGRLAAGVAHDFNNLLTIINGSAELATYNLAPDDPAMEDLSQILAAGARAAALTRQLLAFSRQAVVMPMVLNLDEVIEGFRKMLGRLLPEHITFEVHLGLPTTCVRADAGQLEQVLLNLVVNARDAMSDRGLVRIETTAVTLHEGETTDIRPAIPAGRYACVSCIDMGEGMDAVVMSRMFEPFFTTKVIGKGTGLGLSTVLNIVERSAGGIRVTSRVGSGTRFDVFLPEVAGESPVDAHAEIPAPFKTTEAVILLVEDEEMLRALAMRTLTQAGFHVVAAGNGREGLEASAALTGPLDLVITDVIMPEMGGREMAEALALQRPTVPVLYTSGYTGDRGLVDWLNASGVAFLAKPYLPAELVKAAATIIDTARSHGATPGH